MRMLNYSLSIVTSLIGNFLLCQQIGGVDRSLLKDSSSQGSMAVYEIAGEFWLKGGIIY